MGLRYRDPFHGKPHRNYRRETTRNDGEAPCSIGYSINESWGALKKCWRAYKIARVKGEAGEMEKYAKRIRKLQFELDIGICEFPDIGILGTLPEDVDLLCD